MNGQNDHGSHKSRKSSGHSHSHKSGAHSAHGSSSSHAHSGSGSRETHYSHLAERQKKIDQLAQKYVIVEDKDRIEPKPKSQLNRHKKRRSLPLKILRAAAVVIAILLISIAAIWLLLNNIGRWKVMGDQSGVVENDYAVSQDEGKTLDYSGVTYKRNENLVSIALLGVDKEELGTTDGIVGTAGQADTIMVVVFDVKTGDTKIISIPRDSMAIVDLYSTDGSYVGEKTLQICLAHAYGNGTDTSCENVIASIGRLLYGIPINLYASLDLSGISALNDAVGGVTVEALESFGRFKKGDIVTLDGAEAVDYVRHRDTLRLDSDSDRRDRQIQYSRAYVSKAAKQALGSFSVVSSLYNKATYYSYTNVTLSMATYFATTFLSKGVSFDKIYPLRGEIKLGESGLAEFYVDEKLAFETVLEVYYTKEVNG